MTPSRAIRTSLVAAGIAIGMTATLVASTETAHGATHKPIKKANARVFVVGDSLTVGAAPYLRPYLRPHVRVVNIDAQVSRTTPQGLARLNSPVARASNIWVVGLGTNDSANPLLTHRYVMHVLTRARGKIVIWTNVVRPGYASVNLKLAQLDRRFAHLVVVDWANFIRANRSLLTGDGVHLTARGYQLRAVVLAKFVRARVR